MLEGFQNVTIQEREDYSGDYFYSDHFLSCTIIGNNEMYFYSRVVENNSKLVQIMLVTYDKRINFVRFSHVKMSKFSIYFFTLMHITCALCASLIKLLHVFILLN